MVCSRPDTPIQMKTPAGAGVRVVAWENTTFGVGLLYTLIQRYFPALLTQEVPGPISSYQRCGHCLYSERIARCPPSGAEVFQAICAELRDADKGMGGCLSCALRALRYHDCSTEEFPFVYKGVCYGW